MKKSINTIKSIRKSNYQRIPYQAGLILLKSQNKHEVKLMQ